MGALTVFTYLPTLDAFIVAESYAHLAQHLGLGETARDTIGWIGELFALDNDNDNGHAWLRDPALLATKDPDEIQALAGNREDLLVIDPAWFADGYDGPCHPETIRKAFWTEVLKSLTLQFDTIADEACRHNAWRARHEPQRYLADLDKRIAIQVNGDGVMVPTVPTASSASSATVRVFDYLADLDAFLPTPAYAALADELGLTEWHSVVWIGRLLMLDNDYGEHWFDNWDEREAVDRDRAVALGLDLDAVDTLLIVAPDRFVRNKRTDDDRVGIRKAFWTDVLRSLSLSVDFLIAEARHTNEQNRELDALIARHPTTSDASDKFDTTATHVISDLDERIAHVKATYHLP